MGNNQQLNWNLEQLTDAEIDAAIRYLDPDPRNANEKNYSIVLLICVILAIVLWGYLGFVWLYG